MPFLQLLRIPRRASRPFRVFADRPLLRTPCSPGAARVDARHRRRLRADRTAIRKIAGDFDGHAGRRPPLLPHRRARRARPQDACGEPVGSRGDGRRTARVHARVRAAACCCCAGWSSVAISTPRWRPATAMPRRSPRCGSQAARRSTSTGARRRHRACRDASGRGGRGQLVAFDTTDFIGWGLDEPGMTQALAYALGWYVDVSISLRASP